MKKYHAWGVLGSIGSGLFLVAQRVSAATCTLNGREVDCAQLSNQVQGFIGPMIGFFFVFFLFMIVVMAFWIWMIVHVATKPVEDKALWIVLMVFTGWIGAIIYYFVVKRPFDKKTASPQPTPTQ